MTARYYLSPLRQIPLNLSMGGLWNKYTESTKLQLTRGVMYLMRLNGVIKQASNSTRSIDEVVRALLHASRDGRPYGLKEWQLLLGSEIGESLAREEFTAMKDGKLIIPSSDTFGPCFKLERHDKLMFDIGFEIEREIIRNLDPSSRAALSGLQDGDRILEGPSSYWDLSQAYEDKLMLIVEREGSPEALAFQFWPRGWTKVEAYEWLANSNAPDHCMNQVEDTEPAGWIFD
jgi:predicted metalloprotease with PDZ domain